MRFITASLGVECSYCHVPDHFEKDDKKPKEIARNMMRMMFAIDKDSFAGNREVTCYSCHRGSTKPEGTPAVASDVVSVSVAEKLAANLPTADELIHNYIQAVGGAAAIERIASREEKGSATLVGKSFGVEIFTQDPDKQALIRHTPSGDSAAIFDGQQGWFSFPNRPTREMHEADLEAARIDADLHFPINIKKNCAELRVEYPEKIGTRAANVISCANVGKPPIKFYFDDQSKLLVRIVRYAPSPLGAVPTQIDYSDYRDADGVKGSIPLDSCAARWNRNNATGAGAAEHSDRSGQICPTSGTLINVRPVSLTYFGSVILKVRFSSRPEVTTCFCPEGQTTSTLSIFVASPSPK